MAVGIAVLFFGIVGHAKTAGYCYSDVPDYIGNSCLTPTKLTTLWREPRPGIQA